jgi:hypothetical protein
MMIWEITAFAVTTVRMRSCLSCEGEVLLHTADALMHPLYYCEHFIAVLNNEFYGYV